ncbi:MAG: hypothetical protein QM734_06715 [Cyclobacteriaceae bacterium]
MKLRLGLGALMLVLSISSQAQTFTSTAAGGAWNSTGTWTGNAVPTAGSDVIINGPVSLNVNTPSLNSLTVNSGVTFTTTTTFTVNVTGAIAVNGTYANGSTGVISFSTLNFNANSTYIHNLNGGTIPTATSWASNSTCQISITGNTLPTSGLAQNFGNFTWNSPSQTGNVTLTTVPTAILGDFSVVSTNASALRLTNTATSRTLTIGGNYNQTGGSFTVLTNSGNGTLSVGGNFNLSGGTFTGVSGTGTGSIGITGSVFITGGAFNGVGTGSGPCTITVGGSMNLSAGSVVLKGSGNGTAALNITGDFDQSGTATFTQRSNATSTSIVAITGAFNLSGGTYTASTVNAIGTINLSGNFSVTGGTLTTTSGSGSVNFNGPGTQTFTSGGTISNAINFTVPSGVTLQMASSGTVVSGGGSFTLSSGATLGVTSPSGITISGAGNIQVTGTRTYTSGANYIYNGGASQSAGDGLGQNTPATITVNNSSSVSLSSAVTTSGIVSIASGSSLDAAGQTLTAGGLVTVNGTYASGSGAQTLNNGLTISGGTFTGSTGTVTVTDLNITSGSFTAPSGTLNISGNFSNGGTLNSNSGTVFFTGSGTQTLNSGGSSFNNISHTGTGTLQLASNALNALGTFTNSTGTFAPSAQSVTITGATTISGGTYSGSSASQNFNGGLSLTGGIFNGSSGDVTILGNLSIGNSTTFKIGASNLTVSGTTTVGAGSSGNFTFLSTTGTKIFGDLVVVSAGATWDNSINSPVTFQGGLKKNASATFTSGTGVHTFDTNSQSLSGTFSIPNLVVTGVSLDNNGTLTVGTSLSGTGSLSQSSGANLTLSGSSTLSTLNATNSGNTVIFNGTTQTINVGTYYNLTISQSGATNASLAGSTSVNGALTFTSGNILLGSSNLSFGASATISGGSSSSMIIVSGAGLVKKTFSSASSFVFPIGENTGSTDYSPITVAPTAGSFPADVSVSVIDAKHPNNASATNYLTRYWNVLSTNPITVNLSGTYLGSAADINGTEANASSAQLDGTFSQLSNPWVKFAALGSNTLSVTGANLTANQTSAFTGITGANPSVSIIGGGISICSGSSTPLTASISGGDPSFTYVWSPTTGLSASNISNPSASPTSTTAYTVSVRDGNGILATSTPSTITVSQVPTTSAAGPDQTQCNNGSFTLAGNNPTTGTGAWSIIGSANGASITSPTSFNSTVTGLTSGNNVTLRWTISNGACTASIDDVLLTNDALPTTANAGGDINQCNNSSFTLAGNLPTTGTGQWSVVSGAVTITTPGSNVSTVTGLAAGGSATLRWTITNGTCSTSDDVVLTNDALPTTANAGVDINQCNNELIYPCGQLTGHGHGPVERGERQCHDHDPRRFQQRGYGSGRGQQRHAEVDGHERELQQL